ncbi:MAG: TonB-dependent receptor [Woeseiaceae bacterium]|nr:TonB-dependent receptor [Woeseiaceae bacterium]
MIREISLRTLAASLGVVLVVCVPPATSADEIDEIIVTADMLGRSYDELPASVSVLDGDDIKSLAVQHFEELVNVVPNLNWSGDGHRARYFQIRGIGELEQYQGAPNPSVGFLVDDIDFSGIGTIASLFDIERVEVLRGPQGSRFGANALAGLIYMQSAQPEAERNGRLQLGAADDNASSIGVAFGGSLRDDEKALFRVSAQKYESDGFRDNPHLGRSDTNGRDETVFRGRLKLMPSEFLQINIAALHTDIDNGYDAFALDNSYTVLSDKPGRDAQRSNGMSVRFDWDATDSLSLTSISAVADSDIDFGFDADWGNDESWAPFTYDYISLSDRSRKTLSQEFRLQSASGENMTWLVGVYMLRLDEELTTLNQGSYFDPFFNFADSLDETFASAYEADNVAAFSQLDARIGPNTRFSAGLRIERRTAEYRDSAGLDAAPGESMIGGELTLNHEINTQLSLYASLSRGYKAGGFNLGIVPLGRREFSAEGLWSAEVGLRAAPQDNLEVSAAVFLHRREDQQVRTSTQLIPGDPASFVFFTDNAATGKALGFETEIDWVISDAWRAYARIGLLNATFARYSNGATDLDGRRQAHAPRYTFATGLEWNAASGWFARADVSGKDDFYFDVSHNQRSWAYQLVNARTGFRADKWSLQVWARNLLDEDFAVRGFFFGNEPPNFPNTLYTRLGDPRQVGITLDLRF